MRSFWLFEPWPRIALVLTSTHCTTAPPLLKIWMNMNGEYENATSWPNWIQFKQDLRLDDKNFRESWKNRRKISGKCFFSKKWTSLEFGCWHGRSLTQHKICKENSNKVVAEGKEENSPLFTMLLVYNSLEFSPKSSAAHFIYLICSCCCCGFSCFDNFPLMCAFPNLLICLW